MKTADVSQILAEGASANSVYNQSYVSMLRNKWGKLLEGIKGEHARNVFAVLCENQSQYMQGLTEDTRSTNVGSYMKYVLIG